MRGRHDEPSHEFCPRRITHAGSDVGAKEQGRGALFRDEPNADLDRDPDLDLDLDLDRDLDLDLDPDPDRDLDLDRDRDLRRSRVLDYPLVVVRMRAWGSVFALVAGCQAFLIDESAQRGPSDGAVVPADGGTDVAAVDATIDAPLDAPLGDAGARFCDPYADALFCADFDEGGAPSDYGLKVSDAGRETVTAGLNGSSWLTLTMQVDAGASASVDSKVDGGVTLEAFVDCQMETKQFVAFVYVDSNYARAVLYCLNLGGGHQLSGGVLFGDGGLDLTTLGTSPARVLVSVDGAFARFVGPGGTVFTKQLVGRPNKVTLGQSDNHYATPGTMHFDNVLITAN